MLPLVSHRRAPNLLSQGQGVRRGLDSSTQVKDVDQRGDKGDHTKPSTKFGQSAL